jgi:hypothetical protein
MLVLSNAENLVRRNVWSDLKSMYFFHVDITFLRRNAGKRNIQTLSVA